MILVEASANKQSGYFIVDTGSPYLVLNAKDYKGSTAILKMHSFSGTKIGEETKHVSFRIGEWQLKGKLASLSDLGYLEEKLKIPIKGLIGMNVLKHFEILIDYTTTTISLFKVKEKGVKNDFDNMVPPSQTISLYFKEHLPYMKAYLDGKEFCFGLDTGASINLFSRSCQSFIKSKTFTKKVRIRAAGQRNKIKEERFLKSAIQFNNRSSLPMLMLLKDLTPLNKNLTGKDIHGLLGFEFLSQQRIAINFKKKKLYLWDRVSSQKAKPKIDELVLKN